MALDKAGEWQLGVDIGGTFTDVAARSKEQLHTTKILTVPNSPEEGVLAGIRELLAQANITPDKISRLVHGTTLATNAIIEKKGAKTAFITTQGFRDVIEMRTESRFDQYDLNLKLPKPLIPRNHRFTVKERMSARGEQLVHLDEKTVLELLPVLRKEQFESIAIGFLHSHTNPAHELRVRELLKKNLPKIAISISSEVSPEIREYERFTTTCANAYIQPLVMPYLKNLRFRIRSMGVKCPLFLMLSNGGLADIKTGEKHPVRMIESGPAGGAILASKVARECDLNNVISFDMGGTTAKICLLDGKEPDTAREFEVAREYRFKRGSGLPLRIPVIEMVEVGAGGGSICGLDGLGNIYVGPQSAGSEPGPACYGKGGKLATVTDANLILGRIDHEIFADGKIDLLPNAASVSLKQNISQRLGVSERVGAMGVVEMVDENMANAAREHAVERGKSPEGRTMIAFGGSAPLHAARLAEKLGVEKIIIPTGAGVGSAIGFLHAPITYEITRSLYQRLSTFEIRKVSSLLQKLETDASKVVLRAAGKTPLRVRRSAYMRFVGQRHEIKVSLPKGMIDEKKVGAIKTNFSEAYRIQYSRTMPDVDIEIVGWSVSVSAHTESLESRNSRFRKKKIKSMQTTKIWDFSSEKPVYYFVYLREEVPNGSIIAGPSIIAEPQTTTIIPRNFNATVDSRGYIVIEKI